MSPAPRCPCGRTHDPMPCSQCTHVYGDAPADWLAKYPQGADYWTAYSAHLCDGCADERAAAEQAATERYTYAEMMADLADY